MIRSFLSIKSSDSLLSRGLVFTSNPFRSNIDQRSKLFGPNFTINNYRRIPFRSIAINFSWEFGKPEFKKEKEKINNSLHAPAGIVSMVFISQLLDINNIRQFFRW